MIRKPAFVLISAVILSLSATAQSDLRIKKKVKLNMPGVDAAIASMPQKMKDSMRDSFNRTQTVYVKGTRVRTDNQHKIPNKTGGMSTRNYSMITQCDSQKVVQFNDQKKKYYVEDGVVADSKSKKGGFVNVSMMVTDTGERMELFGYPSRHIKQSVKITPGANSCLDKPFSMEIDGWYADIPSYSCPLRPEISEMQSSTNCFDDIVFSLRGQAVTGFPVKEIKSFAIDGQTIGMEEEVTAFEKTVLDASLFEPPAGYSAGNTKAEVYSSEEVGTAVSAPPAQNGSGVPAGYPGSSGIPSVPQAVGPPSLAPPGAGVGTSASVIAGPKAPGAIRVGVAKPAVVTPETKKDPNAGWDVAQAVSKSVVENLRGGGIDAVELSSDNPVSECSEKSCDFIFYTNVTQKRGGGGMFGKMVMMGAVTMAGAMIPGIGSMIATTVASQVMGQTMGKAAKAKDEFTFEHKVTKLDQTVVAQASTKKKTEKDGEDVLSPQIKSATDAVLTKIKK